MSVGRTDAFCAKCGGRQPVPAAVPAQDYLGNISPRTASLLCYVPWIGWLASIVVLASARFRNDARVRFDAFQGLYLFVAWLIVESVVSPMFDWPHGGLHIGGLFKAVVFAAWVFMIIKASQEQQFKLPVLGELAEKSVIEQH